MSGGAYFGFNPRVERLMEEDWHNVVPLFRALKRAQKTGLVILASRQELLDTLEQSIVERPFAEDQRFPEGRRLICAGTGVYRGLMARLYQHLNSRVREGREYDVGDDGQHALNKIVEEMLDCLRDRVDVFDVNSFEDTFGIGWVLASDVLDDVRGSEYGLHLGD